MIETIANFFSKIPKVSKEEIEVCNIGEKRYKSFSEFHGLAKFILRLHKCSCVGVVNVYLKKKTNKWVWLIDSKDMPHEQMICFQDNLNKLDLMSHHNQALIEKELKGRDSFLFFSNSDPDTVDPFSF